MAASSRTRPVAAEPKSSRRARLAWLAAAALVVTAGTLGVQAGWPPIGSQTSAAPDSSSPQADIALIGPPLVTKAAADEATRPSPENAASVTPATTTIDPMLTLDLKPAEALDRIRRCSGLHNAELERWRESQLNWLTPEAQAIERAAYIKARAWARDYCGDLGAGQEKRFADLQKAFAERATRSQDLADRLSGLLAQLQLAATPRTDIQPIRELLYEAIRAGNPELLVVIGRLLNPSDFGQVQHLGIYAGSRLTGYAFALAGCELGAACGVNSELVLHACAAYGNCGYVDYPSLVYDVSVGRDEAVVLRRVVDQIVQRARSGQTAGMFHPPPAPTPPPPG